MGLFRKRMAACPICESELEAGAQMGTKLAHFNSHVQQIPPGNGEASGQYTWVCACGPAGMKWPHDAGAAAGLALHLQQRHGFPL